MAPLPDLRSVYNGYTPPQFVNTDEIIEMHNVNRFSRGSELSKLITGTSDEQKDYLMGLVIFTICTFIVFVAWTVLLFMLKCCGRKRVGLFSGYPPKMPEPPEENSNKEQRERADTLLADNESPHNTEIHTVARGVFTSSRVVVMAQLADNDCVPEQPAASLDQNEVEQPQSSLSVVEVDQSDTSSNKSTDNMGNLPRGKIIEEATSGTELSSEPDAVEKYQAEVKRVNRLVLWSRIMIIISAVGMFVSTSVFIAEGVGKLDSTLSAGVDGMEKISDAVLDVVDIMDNFTRDQGNLSQAIRLLENSTLGETGLCPNKMEEWVAECETNGTIEGINITFDGANCTQLESAISENLESISESVDSFLEAVLKEVNAIRNDLYEVSEMMENMAKQANSLRWAFYVSVGFACLVDLVVLVLLAGTFLAWKKKLTAPFMCIRSWLIVPAFILLTFLVWLFAIIFCLGGILGADLCIGGPEKRLFVMIQKIAEDFDSITFRMIEYYLTGCVGPTISLLLDEPLVNKVAGGIEFVHSLSVAVGQIDLDSYNKICGVDVAPLTVVAAATHTQIHILADTTYALQRFLLCSNIFPLIERIAFDAVCYLGVTGLRNIYISLLCMLCFSFIFITFRAAWQDDTTVSSATVNPKDKEDEALLEKSERFADESSTPNTVGSPLTTSFHENKMHVTESGN